MKRFFSMRNFLIVLFALLLGMPVTGWAQNKVKGKLSATTRLVIADREGKISLDRARRHLKEMKALHRQKASVPAREQPVLVEETGDLPFAAPFTRNGRKMVQGWVRLDDNNTSRLEELGLQITARFNNLVVANIPVDVLEDVAAVANVRKVDMARMLSKKTYVSRQLTNVDDLLNFSSDAQSAGLQQAYDGTGVVLGVIDTGIDFGHDMLKGTRLKKKYVYDTSSEVMQEYTGSTYYNSDETHGTHTSTIAGGSNLTATAYVYTTGTSYTQVNNAQFGGMAPGTDLVLCDLGEELSDANIAWSMQKIAEYAESVGKPYVISLSLGSHFGAHDGTGAMSEVTAQMTGPGKIIVYASGNEGEDGIYLGKNASASNPSQTVFTSQTRSSYSVDYGAVLSYARTPNTELAVRYHVVNTSSNAVVWSSNEITTDDYFVDDQGNIELYGAEISVNDTGADGVTKLSQYFTAYNNNSNDYGYLCGYIDFDTYNNKWYVETILYYLKAVNNSYKIAMSVYPRTGTSWVDSWPFSYVDFTASSAKYNNVAFTAGTNESSASEESSFPSVISVGSYVSSKYWYGQGTFGGSRQSWTNNGTYQQVSMFSSYQSEGSGPTGLKQPWITAPGEVILAGYNSGYNAGGNTYYLYNSNKKLGAMSGTSMACPCVAGIVALWLQANPMLTPAQIKTAMKETAIKDSNVNGTYASHFGQGKIDALAGLAYILQNYAHPMIMATPSSVSLSAAVGQTVSQTVNVNGTTLEGDITVTMSGDASFTVDKTTVTQSSGIASDVLTISFAPTSSGSQSASITLSSDNAEDVVIDITGTVLSPELIADNDELSLTAEAGETATATLGVLGADLTGGVTVTLSDANEVFSLSTSSISQGDAEQGSNINVTFAPAAVGTYTATVTLSSPFAESVVVTLTGTATPGTPKFAIDKTSMSFNAKLNDPKTETVTLTMAKNLVGDVTATVTDANGVFSVSPASLTAAQAMEGASFTVTFSSANEGEFTGTLTIVTEGAQTQTVELSAVAMDGGTASDPYLNIAKYATIDDAGWRTNLVNNLYKYTEYESQEFAWLTLSVYGAFVGARYATNSSTIGSGHPQAWIECSLNNNNTYGGTTWTNTASATSPFGGSSAYFTSATARAIGYNSRTNTTIRTVSYYVTNITEVKVNGTGRNGTSASYPARLRVFECTLDANGVPVASGTATKDVTSSSTSAFTLTADGLDETKVYKVETSIYRGYLYEIAFQTPLPKEPELTATPTDLFMQVSKGATTQETIEVAGQNLTEDVTVTLNDETGAFSLNMTTITPEQAAAGQPLYVTFAPVSVGTYTASVTLSSAGVSDVTVNITGEGTWTPTITPSTSMLYMEAAKGATATQTVNIMSKDLDEPITATLNDENGVFSLDATSILPTPDGALLAVTFAPTTAGEFTGSVTLSSAGAEDVIVELSATSVPTIEVTSTELTFETQKGTTTTQSFALSGELLSEEVTLTLSDENGFFSLSETAIEVTDMDEEHIVTVTFAPELRGTFTGTITLSSADVEDLVITLTGTSTWTTKVGDVTMNGTIDVADVDAIASLLAGYDPNGERLDRVAADVNKDGFLTIADITFLVNKLLNPEPDYPEDDGEGHDLIIPGGDGEPVEGDAKEEKF